MQQSRDRLIVINYIKINSQIFDNIASYEIL